jgi:hypothetical protein
MVTGPRQLKYCSGGYNQNKPNCWIIRKYCLLKKSTQIKLQQNLLTSVSQSKATLNESLFGVIIGKLIFIENLHTFIVPGRVARCINGCRISLSDRVLTIITKWRSNTMIP